MPVANVGRRGEQLFVDHDSCAFHLRTEQSFKQAKLLRHSFELRPLVIRPRVLLAGLMRARNFFLVLIAGVALSACGRDAVPVDGQPRVFDERTAFEARIQELAKHPLDAPLTKDNSVLFAFEGGPTLRVPKVLFDPASIPKELNEPIKALALTTTFWYPDLTLTDLRSSSIPSKADPNYVPQTSRFWVWIMYMWHVPPDSDSFVPGSRQPEFRLALRPPRIEMNRACFPLVNGHCGLGMRRIPSGGIPEIDALVAEGWVAMHPDALVHHPENGGVYVSKLGAPYELFMDCTAFSSLQCNAYVYSKKHHLEYRMQFPPEAVGMTDALIRTIDRMLDGWPIVSKSKD